MISVPCLKCSVLVTLDTASPVFDTEEHADAYERGQYTPTEYLCVACSEHALDMLCESAFPTNSQIRKQAEYCSAHRVTGRHAFFMHEADVDTFVWWLVDHCIHAVVTDHGMDWEVIW